MVKKVHTFLLSSLLEKFAHISYDLWNGVYCLFFLGEPDIDIPEE